MSKVIDVGYDLSYFMQENTSPEEFEFEAPERFKDKEGNPLVFKFRILSEKEMDTIRNRWRKRVYVKNEKGNHIFRPNGAIAFDEQVDTNSMILDFLTESLVYPNLKDKELRNFHKTQNVLDMPYKVFTRSEVDYLYREFNIAHGFITPEDDENIADDNPSDVDKAKN